jgi:hypothetical protein
MSSHKSPSAVCLRRQRQRRTDAHRNRADVSGDPIQLFIPESVEPRADFGARLATTGHRRFNAIVDCAPIPSNRADGRRSGARVLPIRRCCSRQWGSPLAATGF